MRIELVTPLQHESLVDLLCEVHTYYNAGSTASRRDVREHLTENLLGPASPHSLVVASLPTGEVVGLAAISLVYSLVDFEVGKRKQCQLKELYVRHSDRGHGTGRALMLWVARYALDHGCHRIDWPVKAKNARGIAFYERLGAERVAERLSYRLNQPSLERLAKRGASDG
jgi:GNAT superfamily N-acetyltransferase